jgi:hypothetical protein
VPAISGSPDIRVSFDPDHQDMVAEIYFGGRCLALVSQDGGPERMMVEFYPAEGGGSWRLPLAEIEAAVAYAKRRLDELRARRPETALAGE